MGVGQGRRAESGVWGHSDLPPRRRGTGHALGIRGAARGGGPGWIPSTFRADPISATSFSARASLCLPSSPAQIRVQLGFRSRVTPLS